MSGPGRSATLLDRQWPLWGCALLLYGVGDTTTTVAGLHAGTVTEIGPLALVALEHAGVPGYLLLKGGVLAGGYLLWARLRTPGRTAVPLALAVTGAGVTAWNVAVLLL